MANDTCSNLLRPTGTELHSATLQVRIYHAYDLPQMDFDYTKVKKFFHMKTDKANVDPYCSVKFAGQRRKTEKISSDSTPYWNKQVNFGIRVC